MESPPSRASFRRRAPLACEYCRGVKKRCDVADKHPCTNCQLDDVQCMVSCRKWRRSMAACFPWARTVKYGQRFDVEKHSAASGQVRNKPYEPESELRSEPVGEIDPITVGPMTYSYLRPWLSLNDVPPIMEHLKERNPSRINQTSNLAYSENLDHCSDLVDSPRSSTEAAVSIGGNFSSDLVTPLQSRLAAEDFMYLSLKGAFEIPEETSCNALLEAFVSYVYPFLPILNLSEFLPSMQRRHQETTSRENCADKARKPGSLLLIQAVMFSATPFVDAEYLRRCGFTSRRQARKCFFEKAKLLYSFDCEMDPMIITQALLLMSYWHDTLDNQKGASHWFNTAMDIANTTDTANMSLSDQKLWKRIRWACLTRQCLLSVGKRLPLNGDISSFDIPSLTMDDFELISTSQITDVPFAKFTFLKCPAEQRQLVEMFMAKCQLCVQVFQTIRTHYEARTLNPSTQETLSSRMFLYPKNVCDTEALYTLDQALKLWEASLPENCVYLSPSNRSVWETRNPTIILHQITLDLLLQAATAMLHRPNANRATLENPEVLLSSKLSNLRLSRATQSIAKTAAEVRRLRLDKYLPNFTIMVFTPTILTLIGDLKTSVCDQAQGKIMRNIIHCRRVVESLREAYNGGDHGAYLATAALGYDPLELENQYQMGTESTDSLEEMLISLDQMNNAEGFADLIDFSNLALPITC